MSDEATLFDAAEARRRMEYGIKVAASSTARVVALEIARALAREISLAHGVVTSDDVALAMHRRGLSYEDLGNAAGSIFRCGFAWTGDVRQSIRVSTHNRIIRVWRIKSDGLDGFSHGVVRRTL